MEQLLETIPSMFQSNRNLESAFGAAVKVGSLTPQHKRFNQISWSCNAYTLYLVPPVDDLIVRNR